jgi:hypothetical protein
MNRLLIVLLLSTLILPRAQAADDERSLIDRLGIDTHGFVDARAGLRLQDDPYTHDTSLAETRLQLHMSRLGDLTTSTLRLDLVGDAATTDTNTDLETGMGPVDLREANVLFSPVHFMDVKVGRQILTWGTGDLVFLNDLFPKDWQSFFLGRDTDYLKAPSDAVFVSLFPGFANIDIAYMPQFDPDRYVRGERLSFWNPMLGRISGRDAVVEPETPDGWFRDDEIAVRVSRMVGAYEFAAYGYRGFWKSPEGMDPVTFTAVFPKLASAGASLRGAMGSGLVNAEFAYYHSRDSSGDDPFTPNSELRFLLGYERELMRDLTGAVQYYAEWMQDYSTYRDTLPAPIYARDEVRHTATLRLTRQLMNQNLTLSLFLRYSPSDGDAYVRPTAEYKINDNWMVMGGANVFLGNNDYTFLGQFEDNTNAYAAVRYSF